MASASDQGQTQRSPGLRRAIEQAQLYALEARTQYQQARARGNVDEQAADQLRDAMIRLYEAIKRYREESAVASDWDEKHFDRIEQWLESGRTVSVPNKDRPNSYETKEVPAIRAVDLNTVADVTSELELVAKKLGLAPEVSESTPRTKITNELVEEVEEWRQQNLE